MLENQQKDRPSPPPSPPSPPPSPPSPSPSPPSPPGDPFRKYEDSVPDDDFPPIDD